MRLRPVPNDVANPVSLDREQLAPGVFLLGQGERRLTVYSQQTRALNLAYALQSTLKDKQVLVIGAGAAGLTFAAAASRLGAKVVILDRAELPMSFQRGCRHRYLHPHISEWPADGCWKAAAGLPILDWLDGVAGNVALEICAQFAAIAAEKNIEGYLPASIISLDLKSRRCTWKSDSAEVTREFDCIVLAVGHGIERPVANLPLASYWRDDPVDQAEFWGEDRLHVVSGAGDGGLTDAIRACIWDFDHGALWTDIAILLRGSALEKRALEYEQNKDPGVAEHHAAYQEHCRRDLDKLDELLESRCRTGQRVLLLHRDPLWNCESQQPLFRLLAWRLVQLKRIKTQKAELRRVDYRTDTVQPTAAKPGGLRSPYYKLVLKDSSSIKADGISVRYGPKPAMDGLGKAISRAYKKLKLAREPSPARPEQLWKKDRAFRRRVQSHRSVQGHAAVTLHVNPLPGPNPVDGVYRLRASLAHVPAGVWGVTYDLHPPRGSAPEPRVERRVIQAPNWPRKPPGDPDTQSGAVSGPDFSALIHTKGDYVIRVRLSNGSELESRVVCALFAGATDPNEVRPLAKSLLAKGSAARKCKRRHCFCRTGASKPHRLKHAHPARERP